MDMNASGMTPPWSALRIVRNHKRANALPYVMTILVLALVSWSGARRRLGAPASLGLPSVREER
jgi:ABC-type uncharacterized transport system permease subunit